MKHAELETMQLSQMIINRKYWDRLGKIGNNTYARYDAATMTVAVFLHGNLIATGQYVEHNTFADPELARSFKVITVRTAGWNTPTTRDRINAFLRDNGVPYVAVVSAKRELLFENGHYDGPESSVWETRTNRNGYELEHMAKFVFVQGTPGCAGRWINVDWNLER